MNNLAGASIAVFRSVLGGVPGLIDSTGLAGKSGLPGRTGFTKSGGLTGSAGLARSADLTGNAGPPTSIQALPRVAEAEAPAAVAVISELPLPWQK
jgi:hypothetical protein